MKLTKEQLSQLTPEQKLQLLDLIAQKKRLDRERRETYVPNEGQRLVHASPAIERYCFAGNGSGKTTLLVNEVLWAAQGYNPITKQHTKVPAKIIVVLDTPSKIEDVFLRELQKWTNLTPDMLEKRGKPYPSRIQFENGSSVDFVFHLQEDMAAESIEWDWAFFDEPCPRKLYVAIKRGGRTKTGIGRILLIGTPIAASWLRKDVYEPWVKGERPNTECFRFGTKVNEKNLADGYLEEFSRVLTEKERRIRLEGEFFDLEGLALADLFDRNLHTLPEPRWPHGWPVIVAIDPAGNKPHMAIMMGCTPENKFVVLKELSSRSIPSRFAQELKDMYKGYRVVDIICDSMGSGDYTGGEGNSSFIQVLNQNGVRARATSYDEKQDAAWLTNIREILAVPLEPDNFGKKEPKLKIANTCKRLISDIETVQWAKYKNIEEYKPKLDIESKDALACLKYAIAANVHFKKGNEKILRPRNPVGIHRNDKRKFTSSR